MNSEYVCPNMTDSVMPQTIPIYGNVHMENYDPPRGALFSGKPQF